MPTLPGRLLITAFGFNDAGGGTTVPRLAAKELARRGWDVTVFHAATQLTGTGVPYETLEWEEDGVRLIGVHNRPHGLFDIANPLRELNDPAITALFAEMLDRVSPDVVHFHNLHNLGAALIDQVAVRGLPAYFTTHNYWLICPRAYLLTGRGVICPGPGTGNRCAPCIGEHQGVVYARRLAEIRARASSGLTRILAVSDAVRVTLINAGYPAEMVDVIRQAMPHESAIWDQVGRDRVAGRRRPRLTVGFLGSAYPHKGPQLLVEAAQLTDAALDVRIIGEAPPAFAETLKRLDARECVTLTGAFEPGQLPALLSDVDVASLPSMWWDCAPLAAAECRAARLPLVVPRLGGLSEMVTDELDGLLFDGLSAVDLARQLDRLASEQGLLERLQQGISGPKAFAAYIDELEACYAGERPGGVERPLSPREVATSWKGDVGRPTSLSIINDQITERLPGPVQRVTATGEQHGPPLPHTASVEVRQQWPPDLSAPASGALAAIVPWEFGGIPLTWLEQIETNVDELWVPSDFVRDMYVADGVDPDRVVVIPNGVDLDVFRPATEPQLSTGDDRVRFLFVGGLIWRKAPDILLDAWRRAFTDRDDVVLIIKDFGADGIYGGRDRSDIVEYVESGALPRAELIQDTLDVDQMVELYRRADVLVHPYRGEGFAMPVLEAMACGIPAIVTAGGPTDEFCPPTAGWRTPAERQPLARTRLEPLDTKGDPWILEPDVEGLAAVMREAAADRDGRRARGLEARAAAEALSWDNVAELYAERLTALANRPKKLHAGGVGTFPFTEMVETRVLATPAWRGSDQLDELLGRWSALTTRETSACLYLLADPEVIGSADEVERAVIAAADRGGADLESCADINVLFEPTTPDRDRCLHRSVDVYVPLHPGCEGHRRLATAAHVTIVEPHSLSLALPARA